MMETLRRTGGALATLRKVGAVVRITMATRSAYLGELAIHSIFLVLILFSFAQLWTATSAFRDVRAMTGFTIPQLVWYLAFAEAFVMSSQGAVMEVDREVRTGDLALRLARPLPYPLHHLGTLLGERLFRFTMHLLFGAVVALLVVGPVPLSALALAAALLCVLVAMLADWAWTFSISLLSFWIEETTGLHHIYRRMVMIFGGVLVPLSAYPDWLTRITSMLPFQYLVYAPARIFVLGELSDVVRTLGMQIAWGATGLVPLCALYWLGLRRVAAQGG